MTGPEFAAIRKSLGLSVVAFGRALGYQGTDDTVSVTVRRYEAPNGREIPPWIARLARMYERYGIPFDLSRSEQGKSP
jgi:transcriptional regulator with XRE-family HTH domain